MDIYSDLSQRSDDPEKGVDKVTMLEYSSLPGMVGERFFNLFGKTNGYVDKKEFVKGFSRLYSSSLDTSLKLIFEFYDFDEDGLVNKEDIRIILSYVPI
jgi:Ca2+-binding EF-hand superfamily protein